MTVAARSLRSASRAADTAPRPAVTTPTAGRRTSWHDGILVGFDLETTGTDTASARVVTAALVHVAPTGAILPQTRRWILDPGIEIPDDARAVHGISTEYARQRGGPALTGLWEILDALEAVWSQGRPLVVFNAPYDLTLIDSEAERYGLPGLTARPSFADAVVIDPLVIDRFVDRDREGSRTLEATAGFYGVPATDPHTATGDALTACLVARQIARAHPMVAAADGPTLHSAQASWYRQRSIHVQALRRSRGEPDVLVDKGWPRHDGLPVWFFD